MSYAIDDEHRKILDLILPYFEFNEVIDVKSSLRKSMEVAPGAPGNLPIGTIADVIKSFLIDYSFAVSYAGEPLVNSRAIALKNAGSLHNFQRTLQKQHDFVLIDDDNVNNIICKTIIGSVHPSANIKAFTDPNVGLRHIQASYREKDANDVILLLDINMPTLFGWEVLDEFKNFSETTKDHFKIFMLTSSVNPKDKERAIGNPYLWGYIEKPLRIETIKSILIQNDPFNKKWVSEY